MTNSQVIERPQQSSPLVVFRERLLTRRSELESALEGSGISADRFIRTAITAVQMQPELISDVSFQSLWVALQKACRDQLLPDGVSGAIIPYKRQAQWQPMYRGLISRFERSGEYKWITANLHREDDKEFDVWVDEHGQHFLHRPGPGLGKVIDTYACATTKSGAFFITVVNEQDMQHIRNVSRARSEDSPWQQWPDQMRLKTALKRLCKLLPMPQPLEELVRRDEDEAADAPLAPTEPAPRLSRPRGAASALEQFAGEPEPSSAEQAEATRAEHAEMHPPPAEQAAEAAQAEPPPAEDPPVPQVRIDVAYERGKDAKRQGVQRKAVPPEYREPNRGREAVAWRKGWDGDPLDGSTS